jgi:RecA-family ATPase
MSVNTNGSALRYEAALKDKDIITQIIQENRDIDLAYNSNPVWNDEKKNFKSVYNWSTLPSYSGQSLESGQVIIRNKSTLKEVDWDIYKYLPAVVAERIKNKFPKTLEFGRAAKGHSVYKIINPAAEDETKRNYLGEKCLLEYRTKGTYSIFVGKLDAKERATVNPHPITEIEDKKLKDLFNEASLLAGLYLITPEESGYNNLIMAAGGEMAEQGVAEDVTQKLFEELLDLKGINRHKETRKSIEGIYKSGKYSNIFSDKFSIPIDKKEKHSFRQLVKELLNKTIEPLEVYTYNSDVVIKKRRWIIKDVFLKGGVTIISGAAGIGKTTAGTLACFSVATGKRFFNYDIFESGNALMIVNEESFNEVNLKLKGIELEYGSIQSGNKIDLRTIEQTLKLAKFGLDGTAKPTTDFKRLEALIKTQQYKLIWIDPLVSTKEGSFDENSNDNMETLLRDFIIKLAQQNDLAIGVGHHTNKVSANVFQEEDNGILTIDNLAMQYASRGASALPAAARAAFVMAPMPKKAWEDHYEEAAAGKYKKNDLVLFADAKNNYSQMSDKPLWLEKVIKNVKVENDDYETTSVLKVSGLSDMALASYEVFKKANEAKIINLLPDIKKYFNLTEELKVQVETFKHKALEAPINSLANYLGKLDAEFQNGKVKAATINSRIKRLLETIGEKGMEIPNTKLKITYHYDRYESKTKHKIVIRPIMNVIDFNGGL